MLPERAVVLVEGVGVFLAQPLHLILAGRPGVEGGGGAIVVEHVPRHVAQVILLLASLLPALRGPQPVSSQVGEQGATVLFGVNLPGLLPAHHPLGQHVIHHHGYQRQHAISAPEPLVHPGLHNGEVVGILLQDELDHLQAQRHVTRFIRLRREAERHGAHVSVVGSAADERYEQQVGEHVFEREADGDHELEGA